MAPEIMVKASRLKSASLEDLKKVNVWALGLVMFNLVNPNLKHPFQLDLVKDLSAIEQVEEFLRPGKNQMGRKNIRNCKKQSGSQLRMCIEIAQKLIRLNVQQL